MPKSFKPCANATVLAGLTCAKIRGLRFRERGGNPPTEECMSRRDSIRLSAPWPVYKFIAAAQIAAHGLIRWRWDWFRCAWHVLNL